MRGGGSEAGFTLIETLVALTLIAMMTLGLFASLRFGARAWETGEAHLAQSRSNWAEESLLRHLIAGTEPRLVTEAGGVLAGLSGTATDMRFAARWLNDHGPRGLLRFTLKKGPDGRGLMLERQPLRLAAGAEPADNGRLLFGEAEDIRLSYFGAPAAGGRAAWRSDWPPGERLPDLVRIALDGGTGPDGMKVIEIAPSGAVRH